MKRMRGIGIGLVRVMVALIAAITIALGQDMTVEWKASLLDLERRLPGLPAEGGSGVDAWRSDAEALRSSIVSAASSYADGKVQLPEALPAQPSQKQLEQQLSALSAAVDQAPAKSRLAV